MTKVFVVDDSSLIRLILSDMLNADSKLKVVATASGKDDVGQICIDSKPDVVVMDLEPEEENGRHVIRKIMDKYPVPIIIVASAANNDRNETFCSLPDGAYYFLEKPASAGQTKIREINKDLISTVYEAVGIEDEKEETVACVFDNRFERGEKPNYDVLVVGVSTGGPGTLSKLLSGFPQNFPIPILIALHMPEAFIPALASRLDRESGVEVRVAKVGDPLANGKVYFASGKENMVLNKTLQGVRISETTQRFKEHNDPSIDCLMQSVVRIYGEKTIGAVLTGMGRDGVSGLNEIREAGGLTIAQDESTSVIYGMPKVAAESGAAEVVLPVQKIPEYIISSL